MDWKKTLIICGIILIIGAVVTTIFFITEPKAERSGATKETAMLVEVTGVERGTYRPNIVATGTVEPAQDIILSPRVSGQIINVSSSFVPGGFVRKGETLLQIDPSDYKNMLEQRKSDLSQAETELSIEMGRQEVAEKDYELLDEALSSENKSLVLREPQLNAAKAKVEAMRAAVSQAELDLQRTTIRAPFDAHILSRNANVGSQVSQSGNLGRLVGLDEYWVVATVPLAKLRWLTFPNGRRERGSEVRLKNKSAWEEDEYRIGYISKLVGALENQTRMARVIVSVPDPLVHGKNSPDVPPLMIGTFVEVHMSGKEIEDVIKLNRDYIRNDETVWVMEGDELRIKEVNIIFRDAEHAYITEGLNKDDKIVTTNLSTVVDGSKLRLESSAPSEGGTPK